MHKLLLWFLSIFLGSHSVALASTDSFSPASRNVLDIILPLANMGVGTIIAILLIWQVFPILHRHTEILREIAATLDIMANSNLKLAEKLIEIIEHKTFKGV